MNTLKPVSSIKSLRELSRAFSTEQLARCIDEQIAKRSNRCTACGDDQQVINVLSRAGVISRLMDEGASQPDAMRELGRRMRNMVELAAEG